MRYKHTVDVYSTPENHLVYTYSDREEMVKILESYGCKYLVTVSGSDLGFQSFPKYTVNEEGYSDRVNPVYTATKYIRMKKNEPNQLEEEINA